MVGLITLLEPGDRVLLPSPFNVNNEMSVRIARAVLLDVLLWGKAGFPLFHSEREACLEAHPRTLDVISPNNPTGAAYHPEELERMARRWRLLLVLL